MSNRRKHITPTHRIGRHIAAVAVTLLLLTACHYLPPFGGMRGGLSGRLGGGIDSLINSRPDSALTLLNSMADDTSRMSRRDLMRYYLLRTNAENKCDTVLTARHAALMRRVCDYYDRHSSKREANNRMLAHYLLGRCYSDMGEAPNALQEFHIAVDAADTLSTDCDFHTLSRVYIQMANLYYMQNMPEEHQDALSKLLTCTGHTKENGVRVWAVHSMAAFLEQAGKKKEALQLLQKEYSVQKRKGEMSSAAQLLGLMNSIKVDLNQTEGLQESFNEYERYSGFFTETGNIVPGKELFYVHKGKYYMSVGKSDSAAILFRKCLTESFTTENKYASALQLLNLYERSGNADSLVKYSKLSSELSDSLMLSMQTKAVVQQEALYNYARSERQAKESIARILELRQEKFLLSGIVALCVLLAIIIYALFRNYNKKKSAQLQLYKERYSQAIHKHEQTLTELHNLQEVTEMMRNREKDLQARELAALMQNAKLVEEHQQELQKLEELVSQKERQLEQQHNEITTLNGQLSSLQKQAKTLKSGDVDGELEKAPVVVRLRSYLDKSPYQGMTGEDKIELRSIFRSILPIFYHKLVIEGEISISKYDICMLYRVNFRSAEIAKLLGVSKSAITQARKKIYFKMTGRQEEDNEFMVFIKQIL